jgi:hypothetical protein
MAFVPKVKKLLTRPVLKLEIDTPRYVKVVAAMYIGKEMKKKKDEDKQKEPATLIDVIDLETGEPCQIVANTVLKSTLAEEYPAGADGVPGYVNKCFSITKQAKQPNRDYNKFKIEEIEDPNDAKEPAAAETSAATPIGAAHASGKRK